MVDKQLVKVRAVREKDVIDRQAMKDAAAVWKVLEREVLMRSQELEKLKGFHKKTLLARRAVAAQLKVQLSSARKSVAGVYYERDGDKARFQQLQSGQQRYHVELFRVQNKIGAMGVGLVKDGN